VYLILRSERQMAFCTRYLIAGLEIEDRFSLTPHIAAQ
jgi:hypothetical protein